MDQSFKVGLFTLKDGAAGTDAGDFVPVAGRTGSIEVAQASDEDPVTGNMTFRNLEFAPTEAGTTYYVFEVDKDGNPVLADAVVNGYTVSYGQGSATNAFALTKEQHDFDGEDGHPAGATVTNTSLAIELQVLKVDKATYDASDSSAATPLSGAEFTLTQLNENDSTKVAYKTKADGTTLVLQKTVATDTAGIASLADVSNGCYEVTETKAPTGYVMTNDVTFYFKVENGVATYLQQEDGVAPVMWGINPSAVGDVLKYELASAASGSGSATPATVTVGNTAGSELPHSGGVGTIPLYATGAALMAVATRLLARRRTED